MSLSKTVYIKALVKCYDPTQHTISMIFLPEDTERFTKNFVSKYYISAEKRPINIDESEFYIKVNKPSRFFIDKLGTVKGDITQLIDKVVTARVKIHNYSFNGDNGKKITGWYLTVVKMVPV